MLDSIRRPGMHCSVREELREFRERPFTFKLSDVAAASRKPLRSQRISKACDSCGSVIILGASQKSAFSRFGKAFCDIQCAGDYKRFHNLSKEYQDRAGITAARAEATRRMAEAEKLKWACCDWCWRAFKKSASKAKCCSEECKRSKARL